MNIKQFEEENERLVKVAWWSVVLPISLGWVATLVVVAFLGPRLWVVLLNWRTGMYEAAVMLLLLTVPMQFSRSFVRSVRSREFERHLRFSDPEMTVGYGALRKGRYQGGRAVANVKGMATFLSPKTLHHILKNELDGVMAAIQLPDFLADGPGPQPTIRSLSDHPQLQRQATEALQAWDAVPKVGLAPDNRTRRLIQRWVGVDAHNDGSSNSAARQARIDAEQKLAKAFAAFCETLDRTYWYAFWLTDGAHYAPEIQFVDDMLQVFQRFLHFQ